MTSSTPRPRLRTIPPALAALAASLLLCIGVRAQEPAAAPAAGSTAFYRGLLEKEVATFSDGCHVAWTLLAGREVPVDYPASVAALRDAGVLAGHPADPLPAGEEPLTKGDLSLICCRILGIRGGVMRRILRNSPRYAYKEMLFLGLVESGGERQRLSGAEVISILALCQEWREEQAAPAEGGG